MIKAITDTKTKEYFISIGKNFIDPKARMDFNIDYIKEIGWIVVPVGGGYFYNEGNELSEKLLSFCHKKNISLLFGLETNFDSSNTIPGLSPLYSFEANETDIFSLHPDV